jgi:hypothetical protein
MRLISLSLECLRRRTLDRAGGAYHRPDPAHTA